MVYELAQTLIGPHVVPSGLYRRAKELLGDAGIVDVTMLLGWFTGVSLTLAASDVPADAVGLEQPVRKRSGTIMPATDVPPQAKLTPVAYFPKEYFLENLAIRSDNSVLVSAMNHKELWYVPSVHGPVPVEPVCIYTFSEPTLAIVEIEPDIFYVSTGNIYTTHEGYLHRLDMRGWAPGQPLKLATVFQFPDTARGLNGACLIAPKVMLVADSFASLIWRVDLPAEDGGRPTARIWLQHESMGYFPGELKPEQPGVNGVRYAAKTNHLYYSATAKKLFMRGPVDPQTHEPAGEPELVVAGRMGDDFCLDEENAVIYLTTHRQNTIDRVSMDPGKNSGFTQSVAGDPFTEHLIGPSSGAWGRGPGEEPGRIAYFLTDGGTASPPPDGPQPATLTRVEFPSMVE